MTREEIWHRVCEIENEKKLTGRLSDTMKDELIRLAKEAVRLLTEETT